MSAWDLLDRHFDRAAGQWSVCVEGYGGEAIYARRPDDILPAASLIKVPLAMALIASDAARRQGKQGVDLGVSVALREEDRVQGEGALEGSFDHAPAGTVRTGWELLAHAIQESDNTASNLLIAMIGMAAVNQFMRSPPLRLTATRLQRRFIDFAAVAQGRDNLTTAREMCMIFRTLVTEENYYAPLVRWLRATTDRAGFEWGGQPGVEVARKGGSLPGVEHGVEIVYAADGSYVAAMLSTGISRVDVAQSTMRQGSRLIFETVRLHGIRRSR